MFVKELFSSLIPSSLSLIFIVLGVIFLGVSNLVRTGACNPFGLGKSPLLICLGVYPFSLRLVLKATALSCVMSNLSLNILAVAIWLIPPVVNVTIFFSYPTS